VPRPRAQLDTAALARAFVPGGLHGTSIETVAAAVGLAKPTLYARGGDKEELFALAVEAEVERLLDRLSGGLIDLARALDDHRREAPEGARLLFATARLDGSERVLRSLRRIRAALTAALGDEVLAAALVGAAMAALDGGPSVERVARLLPAPAHAGPPSGVWTA
jgi:AcrR family transcriptional regulator